MTATARARWLGAALLAGAGYFVIGKVFAVSAGHPRAWRLAAWLVSGVIYAAHIGYEHYRLRHAPLRLSMDVALAVAIGALALAIAGMIHNLSAGSSPSPLWALALLVWPAATAIPGFLGAFLAGSALARPPSQTGTSSP